jgi:hypothetical protein
LARNALKLSYFIRIFYFSTRFYYRMASSLPLFDFEMPELLGSAFISPHPLVFGGLGGYLGSSVSVFLALPMGTK